MSDLEAKGGADHIRAAGIVAVSAIQAPWAGPLAALMSEYIPTTLQKRQAEVIGALEHEMKRLETKIDKAKISSETFHLSFIKAVKFMISEGDSVKQEAFKAIILNDAITPGENFEKEFFMAVTESLTGNHIRVLKILCDPPKCVQNSPDLQRRFENLYSGGISALLEPLMSPLSRGHLEAILDDLYQKSLSTVNRGGYGTTTNKSGILQKKTTEIGERYMQFITLP